MQWQWKLLRAGSFRLDGGSMFGVVPKAVWSKMTEPDEQNRISLQTNCLLLEGDGKRILIETGLGEKWTEKDRTIFAMEKRTIVDALAELEIEPAEIDAVIVTHLHFDHAGALTRFDNNNKPVSTFPNAKIYSQKTEWEDALANKSTMTKTYLRSHLDPVKDQMELIDGEIEILPGVIAWPMPGHTWGQQAIRFNDDKGVVCFPGDVMPTINHVGSVFSMGYDMMPYVNMMSKQQLLTQAMAEGWRIVIDHEPGDAIVTVERDSEKVDRMVLVPIRK